MITNKIIELGLREKSLKNEILDFASRYHHLKLIYYSDLNILTFETYEKINILKNERNAENVRYYLITKGTEYKPWLVSQEAYNDPGYWWLIMEFNDIFDIEDFQNGKTIKIPPASIILK